MSLEFCYKSLKSQGCCSKKRKRKEKLYQKTLYGKACVCPKSVSYQNINAVNINAVIRGTKKLNSEYLKAVCRCSVVQLGVWLAGLLLRCVSQWYMKDSKASVLPSFDVHSKRLINFSHIPPKLWWLASYYYPHLRPRWLKSVKLSRFQLLTSSSAFSKLAGVLSSPATS